MVGEGVDNAGALEQRTKEYSAKEKVFNILGHWLLNASTIRTRMLVYLRLG
ncbi:hypothetical protein WH47_02639 [Habropoda laboriosa]|uniref:Uncharacterized protein n=1 Tax=Habropoda laboriosa TaxID=597456 RepID=A0A0L7QX11_9HYME|nr:hypothetical protein WH47_02639 [Habropoda laboriosa]